MNIFTKNLEPNKNFTIKLKFSNKNFIRKKFFYKMLPNKNFIRMRIFL